MSSARRVLPDLLRRLSPPHRLRQVYERVLGTELEVQVVADTRDQAEEAERRLGRLYALYREPGEHVLAFTGGAGGGAGGGAAGGGEPGPGRADVVGRT